MPVPGGDQLGAGQEEPLGDQGQDQIAPPRRPRGDERIQAEPSDHGQDGFDMSVGQGTKGLEGLGGGDEGLPPEGATDQVDDREWEVREASPGLVLDLSPLSEGTTKVIAGIGDTLDGVGDFSHMDGSWFACHSANIEGRPGDRQGQDSSNRNHREAWNYANAGPRRSIHLSSRTPSRCE